jgi:hypothetical protein
VAPEAPKAGVTPAAASASEEANLPMFPTSARNSAVKTRPISGMVRTILPEGVNAVAWQCKPREALALTKMDWNNTHLDNGEPITLRVARNVGDIPMYVEGTPQPRYSYYM